MPLLFVRNLFAADSAGAVLDEYVEVVTDPAHMLAELTFVLTEVLVLAPLVALWVQHHDRTHHGESVDPSPEKRQSRRRQVTWLLG